MPAGRPTKYRVAQREKFLFNAIEELNSVLDKHRSGEKVLDTKELIALCQPLVLKDMAEKLEIESLNDLNGEQKYSLIMRYMDSLPSADRPRLTA